MANRGLGMYPAGKGGGMGRTDNDSYISTLYDEAKRDGWMESGTTNISPNTTVAQRDAIGKAYNKATEPDSGDKTAGALISGGFNLVGAGLDAGMNAKARRQYRDSSLDELFRANRELEQTIKLGERRRGIEDLQNNFVQNMESMRRAAQEDQQQQNRTQQLVRRIQGMAGEDENFKDMLRQLRG
ncbi:MAG: hypothetical protein GY941_22095 [Planctomycetes bacterium]|nr:hypothetical protein [Planctomycetota bacterium]